MLESQAKQFSLNDEGRIFWQKNATNPLPGEPVAYLVKGKELLRPEVELLKEGLVTVYDRQAVKKVLGSWLKAHIEDVLAPLIALRDDENMAPSARGIAFQLYESLGVIPRGRLMDLISVLDQDGRRDLRQKRVKLGPVLVFLPMLNKPASVRLRAVLWSLYNDRTLPAPVPADGAVSVSVSVEGQDKVDFVFYQSISYPVYGNKAIRIDMLDRVINAVYDSAQDGKFQARHEMAEWLGCSIADLYAVLEAMGHKKIYDPADEPEEQPEEQQSEEKEVDAVENAAEADNAEKSPEEGAESTEKKDGAKQEKPALATFQLKKGQAHKRPFNKDNKKKEQNKRPQRPHKKKTEKSPVVMSAPAKKMDNSPFAVLARLKTENKGD